MIKSREAFEQIMLWRPHVHLNTARAGRGADVINSQDSIRRRLWGRGGGGDGGGGHQMPGPSPAADICKQAGVAHPPWWSAIWSNIDMGGAGRKGDYCCSVAGWSPFLERKKTWNNCFRIYKQLWIFSWPVVVKVKASLEVTKLWLTWGVVR